MSNSINRQVCRKSAQDKKRREISRIPLFEKPVDGEKEKRSILMSRFPRKKEEKGGDG